jgi:hypothetical protein
VTPQDLDCIELVELVTDYFEKALSSSDMARLEAHLVGCEGCIEYVRQMQLTQKAAGRADLGALSGTEREALLAAFRRWKSERDSTR